MDEVRAESQRRRRILLPVDFSPCSEAALAYALRLSEIFEAEIDVLHVWQPAAIAADADLHTVGLLTVSERGQRLKEWLEAMDHHGRGRTRPMLESGDPCATIIEVAYAAGYDMIVMGTNGRSGMRQIISPSVAERVVRKAPCPVVTVRVSADGTVHGGLA